MTSRVLVCLAAHEIAGSRKCGGERFGRDARRMLRSKVWVEGKAMVCLVGSNQFLRMVERERM